ncbi:class I SAM-dependent methyltransferase [Paracoccus methylarcula]|uniref:class I SAM-dependent methyltransferase n=1 Tax=Paracoccus methylarcula TaxID=72022 RepID=UPI001B88305B|nr:class I SAM-dependent methyltransferase [Paracoccus methylarcula]
MIGDSSDGLLSLSEVFTLVEPTGLFVTDLELLRLLMPKPCATSARLSAQTYKVRALYDGLFYRMWEFYLALCEVGFRRRTNIVFQMQLTRQLDRRPITRDDMFKAESDETLWAHRLKGLWRVGSRTLTVSTSPARCSSSIVPRSVRAP